MRISRDLVAGAILLMVGGFLLALEHLPDIAFVIPLLIGLGLLGLFLVARTPALLSTGAVITGIGVGILTATQGSADFGGAGVLVSIGAGFLLVTVLGAIFQVPSVRTWPLVPGLALIALGAIIYSSGLGQEVLDVASRWWPLALVLMGAYLVLAARLRLPLHAGGHDRVEVDEDTRYELPSVDRRAAERRAVDEQNGEAREPVEGHG